MRRYKVGYIEILAALFIGCIIGYGYSRYLASKRLSSQEAEAKKMLEKVKKDSEAIRRQAEIEAKELVLQAKTEAAQEIKAQRKSLQRKEERLLKREENIERKGEFLSSKEIEIAKRERRLIKQEQYLKQKEEKSKKIINEANAFLEKISGMTKEEAKKELHNQLIEEAKQEAAKYIKQIEDETREEAHKKAKQILATAIQRYAGEFVSERTVTVVPLPSEDMKGRIIGREGRNIRTLEAISGVDIIIDDTPDAVVLSGFDPLRRETARITLEKLIADGRIHPTRIEELFRKTKSEIEETIKEAGKQAVLELGLRHLHPELVKLLGKLKYRTSYAQNVLAHSIEVGLLCGIISGELGNNIEEAKRAGLLHDIGKAVNHQQEGTHAAVGASIAKKYKESSQIIHAIAAHHEEEKPQTTLAYLVIAADALSGARPGARRETLDLYLKRIEELEQICNSFKGVERSYAIQAGREVRILVHNSEVDDEQAQILSKEIARKIEKELTYPGQIKVTVIRETRAVEYAK
jgi:ribonuclease Y